MAPALARLLVIMGSGETAPTMVKPHRAIFERAGDRPAVLMDTPYGFQENADDISARAVGYFDASVGRHVDVVSWRSGTVSGLARERALGTLRGAGWIFAGPGSPTYALRQWRDTPVPQILADLLRDGGVVIFASAAALTLGSHTIPVYEIYKAGVEPTWMEGLDLVRTATGLPAVIIPHYDNAEGGHHDTRFCYLGERRLARMESTLPDESFIIGVDEHTAVVLDIDARTATVVGNGTMTIRQRGHSIVHAAGSVLPFDTLTSDVTTTVTPGASTGTSANPSADEAAPVSAGSSLRADTDRLAARFDDAFAASDIDACTEAILDLEQLLLDWAADTLTSDEGEHGRSTLRQMILKLGDLARTGQGTDESTGSLVEILLSIRRTARDARDFATSDTIRDELAKIGFEIRDTPDGATWTRG